MRFRTLVAIGLAVTMVSACGAGPGTAGRARGATLEVMADWSGTEQHAFERVLAGFEAASGVSVVYTPAAGGVPASLAARIAAARPPDVAFLPQPGVLRDYVAQGRLVPLDQATSTEVTRNYGAAWTALASVGGRPYGVWFKAADKSLVWYSLDAFERAGVVPPDTVDGLIEVAHRIVSYGVPAFSLGAADPWTVTDWFENLYLRIAGPEGYDLLADHRIPWTDPSVKDTLVLLGQVLAPGLLAGGIGSAVATSFPASVQEVFSYPHQAAMTSEGDFVMGAVAPGTHATLGVDVDVFPFPAVGNGGPGPDVVGGGDVAVLLRPSPAGSALLRYLATPAAAARWASLGGFISPNLNLDLSVYPDPITRSIARSLLEAGDSFRFDLSDLQPAAFGSTPSAGMQKELTDFLVHGDVDATAARLEEEATAAYRR